MVGSNRVKIAFILICLCTLVLGQDKEGEQTNQLREKILAAYKAGGKQGLLDFWKTKQDKITNKFIEDFASAGVNERKEEWLKACKIMAEDKKDEKTLAHVLFGSGVYFIQISDNKKAAYYFDKALAIYLKLNDPVNQGYVYMNKKIIYSRIGDNSRALEMCDKALHLFEKAGDPASQGYSCRDKGDIYSIIGENSRALEMYEKALSNYKKIGSIQSESSILFVKAIISVNQEKKEKALDLFEKGIANLEKVRTQTAFSKMKRTFMEDVYDQYEETVLFMIENKSYEKGFKYAESMKARVFLDRMAEELLPLEKGLKPELRERRDKLVAKMSNISKEMHETPENKEKKLQELKQQYLKTENEFEDLLIKIRLENPLYASVRYPKPVSLPELQNNVLKKGELLLRFFISPDKTYVFLISKQSFEVMILEVKTEKIKSYVNRWLLAVKENNTGEMRMYGKLLYRGLFKPIELKLKGGQDIIIIPDSHLEKIPFESFIMGEDKSGRSIFLLEKYRIKYIQSASLLSVLRKHYQRDRKSNNFIGFGDPVYDYENFKQGKPEFGAPNPVRGDEITGILRGKYEREGGKLRRLPGSGDEVKAIADLYRKKNQKSVVHLRENATEENAKSVDMKEFDYIHIASHGISGTTIQCLVLSQIPGVKEDGYFTMNEIMNCDYNAKLVVLSACQTGSGKMERAEGVIGLTRAVMYAGTPAVVASLWKVDDPATKELMITFYRNMLEKNMDKTEALRQAKLELINGEKYSSPLLWSAFVMYGE